MRSEQLRAVELVARFGSIHRAATELGLTQPAVSETVKRLEADLGVQLFRRTVRGVDLTRAGSVAIDYLRSILQLERALRFDLVEEQNRESGTFRIGAIGNLMAARVIPALAKLRRQMPLIAFSVLEAGSIEIHEMVASGDLDLGIFAALADEPLQGDVSVMYEFPSTRLVGIVSERHELAGARVMDIADMLEFPLVLLPEGYLRTHALRRIAVGRELVVSCTASHSRSAAMMVAQNLGVSITTGLGTEMVRMAEIPYLAQIEFGSSSLPVQVVAAAHSATAETTVTRRVMEALAEPSGTG